MNKKIATLLFLVPILFFPQNSKATIDVDATIKTETHADYKIDLRKLQLKSELNKNATEEKKERLQESRENYLRATDEERESLRKEFRNRFIERFVFSVNRLSEFQIRLGARLDKMTAEGLDTVEAKLKLSEAQVKLDLVKIKIENLKATLSAEYSDEERESKKEEVKNNVEEIKTGIKETYQKMKEVFSIMKGLVIKNSVEVETEIKSSN